MMRSKFGNPARYAAVAVAALMGIGVGVVLGQTFTDVQADDARRADINYASEQGWFRGYPDGSFRPDRRISEEQLARVIRRAHPGLTRGDAAVFLRGGIDRLRAAGITPTTTTTVATTAAPAGPGETGGPGGDGPVDPNPPVVLEPTTTSATGTTTTTAAADAPTTTAAPLPGSRNLFQYGYETGWMDSEGRRVSLIWTNLAIRDYDINRDGDVALSNWWQREGSADLVITGRDSLGQPASRKWDGAESGNRFFPFTITNIEVTLNCGGREGCVAESGLPMTDSARAWTNQYGYSKIVPTTTTTTTTMASATPTTLPTGRYVAYGKEGGWTNHLGATGAVIWWERRNWDESSPEVTLVMSDKGTIISEDLSDESWFTPNTGLTVQEVRCTDGCAIAEISSMPSSIRDRLLAAGYEKSGS